MTGGALQVKRRRHPSFPTLDSSRRFLTPVIFLTITLTTEPHLPGRVPYIVEEGTTGCWTGANKGKMD